MQPFYHQAIFGIGGRGRSVAAETRYRQPHGGSGSESRELAGVKPRQSASGYQPVLCSQLDEVVLGSAPCWCLCLDFYLQKVSIQGRTRNRSYWARSGEIRRRGLQGKFPGGFTFEAI